MAMPPVRHQRHGVGDAVGGCARDDGGRHDVAHPAIEHVWRIDEGAYDVAFAENAVDVGSVHGDDEGADPPVLHLADGGADALLGMDRGDLRSLATDDFCDFHRPRLLPAAGAPEDYDGRISTWCNSR